MVKSPGSTSNASRPKKGSPFPPGNYIGIDPGVSGGLAVIIVREGEPSRVRYTPTPENGNALLKWLTENVSIHESFPTYAFLEKVGGFISSGWGEGKRNMASGHTMFTFGKSVGRLEMALTAVGIRDYREVIPRTWQKELSVPPRKYHKVGRRVVWDESETEFKNRLKDLAARVFFPVKVSGKIQDALLIAHYGRITIKREKELVNEKQMGSSRRTVW